MLLEYLVTHGSERVVDEARGHISTIKVLRSFQYVDDNGKDEGINGTFNLFSVCFNVAIVSWKRQNALRGIRKRNTIAIMY